MAFFGKICYIINVSALGVTDAIFLLQSVTRKQLIMIQLRKYQDTAVHEVKMQFFAGNRSLVLQLPTGAGKTVIFTHMARETFLRGKSVLVVTDRKELLTQAGGTFDRFELNPDYLTANTKQINGGGAVWIAMVETLKRRLSKPDYFDFIRAFNLIIIDEAHKASFDRLFEAIDADSQFIIGATATPYRIGKITPLREYYDALVTGEQIPALIKSGYLAKAIHYGVPISGLDKVKITAGEFDTKEVTELYSDVQLFGGVVENYRKHCDGMKALLFAASVKNSIAMRDQFRAAGYIAEHIEAETPKQEREDILKQFSAGEIQVLCNVGILTTGYDEPTVEVIITYRPTRSLPLWLQMCGRGSRISTGKDQFIILDFGENTKRHGFWDAERIWTLENAKPPRKDGKGAGAIRECHQCGALLPASKVICEFCGAEKPVKKKEKSEVAVILEQLTPSQVNRASWSVYQMEQVRKEKGYKQGWVLHRLKSKEDFEEYAKLMGYNRGWIYHQTKRYL
jgi:superfamily II DNA or RNA helicase